MNALEHQVFLNAPIGLTYTEHRVIKTCNPTFCTMFGYEKHELIDQSMSLLYATDEEFERVGKIWDRALRQSGYHDDVRIMQRKDGSLFWVRGRGNSLNPSDPWQGGVWSYEDLSAQKDIIELSPRERQICMLLTEGQSAKDMGRILDISPRTVEAHRANLMKKYEVKSTSELIARLASMPLI